VLKVTVQAATPGAESAVYGCLVGAGDGLWFREARAGSNVDPVRHAGVHRSRDHTQQGRLIIYTSLFAQIAAIKQLQQHTKLTSNYDKSKNLLNTALPYVHIHMSVYVHRVTKKRPPFIFLITCQKLTDFNDF